MRTVMMLLVATSATIVQAKTVALWTMAIDGVPSAGTGKAPCSVNSAYDLTIGTSGAIAKMDQDAGWTLPPNPDTTTPTVRTLVGSQCLNIAGLYKNNPCARSANADLIAALTPTNSFTLEGYFWFNKVQNVGSRLMFMVGAGGTQLGSWAVNCSSNTTSGCWRFVMSEQTESGRQQYAQIQDLTPDIPYSELTNGYHHLALTFDYAYPRDNTKSEWRFYWDGVCRGQVIVPRISEAVAITGNFMMFGPATGRTEGANPFGHAYYWRLSDKALVGRELFCYGDAKKSHTVAYWPMNYVSGVVPCAISSVNNLTPRAGGFGATSFSSTDIGWSLPPNFASDSTFFSGYTPGTQYVNINPGIAPGGSYHAEFEPKNDVLASDLSLRNDFTLEYYYRATSLPAASRRQDVFCMSTGSIGGWSFSMDTQDGGSTYRFYVNMYCTPDAKSSNYTVATGVRSEELLNIWNHFALRFKYDNGNGMSEWTVLINGYRRGTVESTKLTADPTTATSAQFYISGSSSSTANDMLGNIGCIRLSRKALAMRELLPFVKDAMAYDDTLVYTSFENASHRYDQVSEYEVVTSKPIGGVSDLVVKNIPRARTVRKAKGDAAVVEADSNRAVVGRTGGANGYPFFSYAIDGNELNVSDFTVETLVKAQALNNGQYIIAKAKDASTTALDWGVFIAANGTTAQLIVDGETVSQQVFDSAVDILSDFLYHHLAVSYDAATKELALWIDYVKIAGCTVVCDLSAAGVTGRTALYFGSEVPNPSDQAKRATSPAVNGSFDAVRVTRRVLTADEMLFMDDNYLDGLKLIIR